MKNKLHSALILLNNVYFENKKFTRETLAEKLKEEGFSHSKNTITELLKFIDEIFGIELSFKNREGIVRIIEDDQNHYHFIKTLVLNGRLQQEAIRHKNHIVSFSSDTDFDYTDFVFEIYKAILQTKTIKITYQKFHTDTPEFYVLKPYLIKEYLERWYLIGGTENDETRVFGIDRIKDLDVLTTTFNPNPEAIKLYKNTIGVNYSGKVEKIKLWVEDYQLKLFETKPLHTSQEILERHPDHGIISLEVAVNYELKQLLASFIQKIKVLEPESLRFEMKNTFKEIIENYES